MDYQEFQNAQNYWVEHDQKAINMELKELRKVADTFLSAHNTCALATGYGSFVRCTPLEYTWLDGQLYILSEGGQKFYGLASNPQVSLAVFEPYRGFGSIESIQITGQADFPAFGSAEYQKILNHKKIAASAISALAHPMYLIRIQPVKMELLFSHFQKEGCDSRQILFLSKSPR